RSGVWTEARRAKAAIERFQFSCMVFMVAPFVKACGRTQAVQGIITSATAAGPKLLTSAAGIRFGGDHVRPSKCTHRWTRQPKLERKPAIRKGPIIAGFVNSVPNS